MLKILKVPFLFLSTFILSISLWAAETHRNGDIVFVRSTSSQSKALEEVLNSHWTHMGILFKIPNPKNWTELRDVDQEGSWMVVEATSMVKFTPYAEFIEGKKYAIKRYSEGIDFEKSQKLFNSTKEHLGLLYDVYFLDTRRYCSGFVWRVYKDALGVELAKPIFIGSLEKHWGTEAEKVITKRFSPENIKSMGMDVKKWKTKTTITPPDIYASPLLIDP